MFGKGWPIIAFTAAMLTGWFVACTGASSEALIEYRRSGGVAGLDDRLVIKENGESILTRKPVRLEFVLDSDTLNRLQTIFKEANFSQLRKEYLPSRPVADSLGYIVSYKGHTVRVVDGAVPPSLQPILEELNQIIERQTYHYPPEGNSAPLGVWPYGPKQRRYAKPTHAARLRRNANGEVEIA